MKYRYILPVIFLFLLACNNNQSHNSLLSSPDEIKASEYSIAVDRDTSLVTENGTILKIPKGTLSVSSGNTANLEIREAYTLSQIVKAGLMTATDGKPLSSGGMLYIGAKDGQNVTINKPIEISMPAEYLEKGMQVYKGEKAGDGNINWSDPQPLVENEKIQPIQQGQVLFQAKCSTCHSIGADLTGPNLAHIMKRFEKEGEGQYRYYAHESEWWREGGYIYRDASEKRLDYEHYSDYFTYKCNLRRLWNTHGPRFDLYNSDSSTGMAYVDIIKYIQNESDRLNLPLPSHAYLNDCADSCRLYMETIGLLNQQKEALESERQALIKNNGPLVKNTWDSTWPTGARTVVDEKVLPKEYDAEYYQFSISSFGWINIDMLLDDVPGVKESELFVRVTGDYTKRVKTYLIIPSTKTYGEGGPADRNSEEFAFFYKTGKLPLPQNVQAYILAVTDTDNGPAYAIKGFTTSTSQTIDIALHVGTKEQFTSDINQLQLDRLHITVADAPQAEGVRKADATGKKIEEAIEKAADLKPKNCECDCNFRDATEPAASYELRAASN